MSQADQNSGYGWKVDYNKLVQWLKNNGCDERVIKVWGVMRSVYYLETLIPQGYKFVSYGNWFNLIREEKDDSFFLITSGENRDDEGAKKLAKELNCEHEEPKKRSPICLGLI